MGFLASRRKTMEVLLHDVPSHGVDWSWACEEARVRAIK